MTESTRVARLGAVEVHLKKNNEVTSEMVETASGLPTSDNWVLLLYNPESDKWQDLQTFDSFDAADEKFAQRTRSNGGEADRFHVSPKQRKRGRVIE